MKKETLNDELRDLSPMLHEQLQRRSDDGMKIPEGYFDGLEDRVFQRLEQEGALRSPAPMRVWFSRRTLLTAAASVALLFAVGSWWMLRQPAEPAFSVTEKPELTAEEVETYVLQNINEFEAEQLADLASNDLPVARPQENTTLSRSRDQRPAVPDLSEEELESILLDMSDEELENILL